MRDKVLEIIEEYADGGTIKEVLKKFRMHPSTFYKLRKIHAELEDAFIAAREFRGETDGDEVVSIADDPDIDPQRARNMIDARKWRASKHYPKVYGDKQTLEIDTGPNLMDAISAAKQRALPPGRNLEEVQDAQYVELPTQSTSEATDEQSDVPPKEAQPAAIDIFEE